MISSSDSQFPFDITMETAYVDNSEGVSQRVTKIDIYPKNSNSKHDQTQSKTHKKFHKHRKISKKNKTDDNRTVLPFISQYLTEKPKEAKNSQSVNAHTPNDNQNIIKKEPTTQPTNHHHKIHLSKAEDNFNSSDTVKQEELLDRLDCIIQKIRTKGRQHRSKTKPSNTNPIRKKQITYPKSTINQQTQANFSSTGSFPATSQSEISQDDYYSYYSVETESDGSFQDLLNSPIQRPNHRNHHYPKKRQPRRTHHKRRKSDTQNKNEMLNENPNTLSPKPQQTDKQVQTIIGGDSLDLKDKNTNLFTESYSFENDEKETYEELEENEDGTLESKDNEEEGDDELDEIEEEEEENENEKEESKNDQNYDQTNSLNDQNYDQTNSFNKEDTNEINFVDDDENENQILIDRCQELIQKNKELLEENQELENENQDEFESNKLFENESQQNEEDENQSQNKTDQTKSETEKNQENENSEFNQSSKPEENENENSNQEQNSQNENTENEDQNENQNIEEEEEDNENQNSISSTTNKDIENENDDDEKFKKNQNPNKSNKNNNDIITTPNRRPVSNNTTPSHQNHQNHPSPPRNISNSQRQYPNNNNIPNYYYNDPNRTYNDPYYNRNYPNPNPNPNPNMNYDPNLNNSYNFNPNRNFYNQPYNNGYYNNNNRYPPFNPNNNFDNFNNSPNNFYRGPNYNNYNNSNLPNRFNNYNGGYPNNYRQTASQNVSSYSPQKSFSMTRQTQIVFSTSNRNNKIIKSDNKNNKNHFTSTPKTPPSLPPSNSSDAESHIVSNITMQDIEMTNKSIMDSSSSSILNETVKKGTQSEMILDYNKSLASTLQPAKKNYTFEPSSIIYGDDGVWMFLPLKEEEEEEEKSEVKNDKKNNEIKEIDKNNEVSKNEEVVKKTKKKKKKSSITLTSNFSKVISILRSHDEKTPKNLAMNISRILTPKKNEHFAFLLDSNEEIVGIYSLGFDASSIEKVWGDDSLEKNLEIEQIKKIFNYNNTSKSFCSTETIHIDNSTIGFSI